MDCYCKHNEKHCFIKKKIQTLMEYFEFNTMQIKQSTALVEIF